MSEEPAAYQCGQKKPSKEDMDAAAHYLAHRYAAMMLDSEARFEGSEKWYDYRDAVESWDHEMLLLVSYLNERELLEMHPKCPFKMRAKPTQPVEEAYPFEKPAHPTCTGDALTVQEPVEEPGKVSQVSANR